jgi:hypothetical protein
MARFIVIHQMAENTTQDAVLVARKTLSAASPESAEWRSSWYVPATNELFCEWEAPTLETIRQALFQSGALQFAPIKILHEVVPVGPKDLPDERAT